MRSKTDIAMVDRNSQQAIRLFVCKTDTAKVLGTYRPILRGLRASRLTAPPRKCAWSIGANRAPARCAPATLPNQLRRRCRPPRRVCTDRDRPRRIDGTATNEGIEVVCGFLPA